LYRLTNRVEATRARACSETRRCRFTAQDALFDALRHSNIILLRASWLRKHLKDRGFRLPKRTELPPEATIDVAELEVIHRNRKLNRWSGERSAMPIIALSHHWKTEDHADPDGATARLVINTLSNRWHEFTQRGVNDLGVFIDFCSVEENLLPAAAEQYALLFAHAGTTVWLHTSGQDHLGRGYWELATCVAESALARLLKLPNQSRAADWPQLVDLGKPYGRCGAEQEVLLHRPPPLAPTAFYGSHQHGHSTAAFTTRSPRDAVATWFQQTMFELLGTVTELNFAGLQWDDAQAIELAAALPLCLSLRVLRLEGNAFGDAGIKAIAAALLHLPAFERISLGSSHALSDKGAQALARAGGKKEEQTVLNGAEPFGAFAKQPLLKGVLQHGATRKGRGHVDEDRMAQTG